MIIKIIFHSLTILLLTSCIGDALVTVNYSVKNKTERPLIVKSKTSWIYKSDDRDTSMVISPNSEKIIYSGRYVCGFSDCRHNIKNDRVLDSAKYCFTDKPDLWFKLTVDKWTIRKHSAKVTIKN